MNTTQNEPHTLSRQDKKANIGKSRVNVTWRVSQRTNRLASSDRLSDKSKSRPPSVFRLFTHRLTETAETKRIARTARQRPARFCVSLDFPFCVGGGFASLPFLVRACVCVCARSSRPASKSTRDNNHDDDNSRGKNT